MSSGSAWQTTTWIDANRLYPCPDDQNPTYPSQTSWGWGTRLDRVCFSEANSKIKMYSDWLISADPNDGSCAALAVASANWEALDCDRPAAWVCERQPVVQEPQSTVQNDLTSSKMEQENDNNVEYGDEYDDISGDVTFSNDRA